MAACRVRQLFCRLQVFLFLAIQGFLIRDAFGYFGGEPGDVFVGQGHTSIIPGKPVNDSDRLTPVSLRNKKATT